MATEQKQPEVDWTFDDEDGASPKLVEKSQSADEDKNESNHGFELRTEFILVIVAILLLIAGGSLGLSAQTFLGPLIPYKA